MRSFLILLSLVFSQSLFSADTLIVKSSLFNKKMMSYRLITQEYITNVNGYFLDIKIDTCFLFLRRTDKKFVYRITYHADEAGKNPVKKSDPLKLAEYIVRFDSASGKAAELMNWKDHRDRLVSDFSVQAAAALISSMQFEEQKNFVNDEKIVRKIVMPDISPLFSLFGDTLRLDAEYMRLKPVRSPMSGKDYLILGSLTSEKPEGTKNTILFHARNKAGEVEKPQLLEEVKEYLFKSAPKDQPIPEIQSVGLNSESDWQYNKAQKNMIKISLADVLAINGQSRGNIRMFELWDQE